MIPHSMFTSVASSKKNWLRLQYPKFQNWKDNNEFPSNKKNKQTEQASAALKFYNLIHSICMYACFCSHHWVLCCYAIRCHVWPQNRSLVCSLFSPSPAFDFFLIQWCTWTNNSSVNFFICLFLLQSYSFDDYYCWYI